MPKNILFLILLSMGCGHAQKTPTEQPSSTEVSALSHDTIIKRYLEEGAWRYGVYSQEWQEEIDKGLAVDSTVAYLWQQKAMPLFKQGKYEIAMEYLDKAVALKPERWLDYRAFMKCIFSKRYKDALADFDRCISTYGNNYVMDHTYEFYRGLCYLQLNEFEKAEQIIHSDIARERKMRGEDWVHHLDLFYLGIALYEQKKYSEAIITFDDALSKYPRFSDVIYFKALALRKMGNVEKANELFEQAKAFAKSSNTINEDNTIYERYPYQVRWQF